MSWNDTLLEDGQEDVQARLQNEEFFEDVAVLLQRKGDIEQDIEVALGVLTEQGGKTGACVVVLMPEILAPESDLPGPPIIVQQSLQVIERPALNQDATTGTLKSAERIALNALNLLHRYINYSLGWTMIADRKPIRPLASEDGLVQYLVVLQWRAGITRVTQVREPEPTLNAGTNELSLACATPSSAIYYTTDGSYPGPENDQATLYSTSFTPGSGVTLVRAAAYRDGYIPSNTIAVDILHGAILTDDDGTLLTDDDGVLKF